MNQETLRRIIVLFGYHPNKDKKPELIETANKYGSVKYGTRRADAHDPKTYNPGQGLRGIDLCLCDYLNCYDHKTRTFKFQFESDSPKEIVETQKREPNQPKKHSLSDSEGVGSELSQAILKRRRERKIESDRVAKLSQEEIINENVFIESEPRIAQLPFTPDPDGHTNVAGALEYDQYDVGGGDTMQSQMGTMKPFSQEPSPEPPPG
jgi:hypothetical protein